MFSGKRRREGSPDRGVRWDSSEPQQETAPGLETGFKHLQESREREHVSLPISRWGIET